MTTKERNRKYYLEHKKEVAEYNKKYRKNHPGKRTEEAKRYREKYKEREQKRRHERYLKNPNYFREHRIKERYGLSIEDYNVLFEKQHGCCAICGTHQSELSKRLSIDHDHKTDEIRGLLCQRCNGALGFYEGWMQKFEQEIKDYLL